MFYTYILQSKKDGSLYVGFTNDLKDRFWRHNQGQENYTSKRLPWILLFYCVFRTREEATGFEKYLKSGSGKEFIRRRIKK